MGEHGGEEWCSARTAAPSIGTSNTTSMFHSYSEHAPFEVSSIQITSGIVVFIGRHRRYMWQLVSSLIGTVPELCTCCAGDAALTLRQSSGSNSGSTAFANTSSIAAANDDYFAASTAISQGLSQLQLSLGTAAPSSLSLYLEPAFFPRAGMGKPSSLLQRSPSSPLRGNSCVAQSVCPPCSGAITP